MKIALPYEVEELVKVAKAWVDSECTFPTPRGVPHEEDRCYGDNHQPDCAVEAARGDLLSCIEIVRRMK